MMKCIIAGTTLETSEKRFSNHSARKTVVNKKSNLERYAIAKVTGHRNIQSLDDYDEAARSSSEVFRGLFREEGKEEKHRPPCLFPVQSFPRCQFLNRIQRLQSQYVTCDQSTQTAFEKGNYITSDC
jgi:hypothetical protein